MLSTHKYETLVSKALEISPHISLFVIDIKAVSIQQLGFHPAKLFPTMNGVFYDWFN